MRKFFRLKKSRLILLFPISIFILGIVCLAGVYLVSFLLGPPKLTTDQNTIYYSINEEVIGEERGAENRYWVDLEEMSPHLIDATLAIEDQYFYKHNGFDLKRIAGAVLSDLKSFSLREGASTLTQQYARNLYLTHDKTWSRKLKEAFHTVRIEMYYSKNEILEGYLNTIYYGHGAHGIEAASRYFFNKSSSALSLAEASMLAAIPKGPTYYSPLNDRDNAEERQERILGLMQHDGDITEQEYFLASRERLAFTEQEEREKIAVAPYFQDTVLIEAADILNVESELVRSGGYEIHTTLDVDLQQELERSAKNVIQPGSEINIGAMAMDPATGGIRALLGGRDYQKSEFNRAISAKRMPGSAFKPFLYYAALNNGYTPSTMLMSKPTSFELEDGKVYQPSNYNGYYANEEISLAQAIALSDNVYAVRTNLFLGADTLVDTARKVGIDGDLPAVPSLALGTAAVSVEDMVTGYGTIANGGNQIEGHTVTKIIDRHGQTIFERDQEEGKQVLDPESAFILTHLMTGMFDRSLDGYMAVTGSSIANQLSRTYAGKSGTTNTDSWMMGYSPSLVAGIWTGYDNNALMKKTAEVSYAKDVWAGFMEAAHKDLPLQRFTAPSGVVGLPIDPDSGERATAYCDTSRVMYFEKGTEPTEYCSIHLPDGKTQENKKQKGMLQKWFDKLF
ncbi:transglycosylase domain-containing protein [Virgibacillus salinus]|uniref:Penicillin-binding protein, 1A family n=1 Tax=Virgibacillus salinus TaxID=553311 RepID=A0A1H0YBL4_9BACI|nr:transglycosylase domain-containing protein [Virgibacillus salinus]SDQ12473.1 penicillin-binding protein, 1A family [Virgibacillus salinus]